MFQAVGILLVFLVGQVYQWLILFTFAYVGQLYLSFSEGQFFFIFFFFSFRATPVAYGNSQARGWFGAAAAGLCHSHSHTGSEPHLWPTATYASAFGSVGSLTHWVRPRIKPAFSWTLCRVLNPLSPSGNCLKDSFSRYRILGSFLVAVQVKDLALSLRRRWLLLWCGQVWSLAQEISHAIDEAKKTKRKNFKKPGPMDSGGKDTEVHQ